MALSATTIFDAIASDYASDPDKSTFITIATGLTSSTCFGDNRALAIALRAAHMIVLRDQGNAGGAAGSVTNRKEGGLAIGYGGAANLKISGDLGQTSYGVQLQGLIDGQITGIDVVGANTIPC